MRKIYVLIFAAISYTLTAQHQYQFTKIEASFKSRLDTYNSTNKVADDSLFRQQFSKIFSTVVLNNGDIVTNGSAFSFTQDKDANIISLNNSFRIIPNRNFYFDIGLNITDKAGAFNFYSSQTIAKDIGLRTGLVIPMWYGGQFFNPEEAQEIQKTRVIEVNKKIIAYRTLMQKQIANLLMKQSNLNNKIEQQTNYGSNDNTDYFKDLKQVSDDIIALQTLLNLDDKGIESLVTRDIAKIDAENNIFTGYHAHWINISGNFMNKSPKLTNDAIIDTLIQKKLDRQFKYTLELSYNINRSTKKTLDFLQLSFQYKRGNFLDNPTYKQPDYTVAPVTQVIAPDTIGTTVGYKILNKNKYVGDYNKLNDSQYSATFSAYLARFIFYQKTLGFSLRAAFNFPSEEVIYSHPQNFTALVGVIFRNISETSFSKANISVQGGVEDLPYKRNVLDRFLVKVSVGIPFNIFSKAKKEDETKTK